MKIASLAFVSFLLTSFARGAEAPAVQVLLGDVKDTRSTAHNWGAEVEIKLVGDVLEDAAAKRAIIKSAVDDTGRNLVEAEKNDRDFQMMNDGYGDKAKVTLKLKNPARKAQAIKELNGEVELLIPKNDQAATVTVEDFAKHIGTPLDAPALKSAGIEVTLWTREQYEAMRQKKMAEGQKEAEGVMGAEIASTFRQFFEGFSSIGPNDIAMQTKDPNDKLAGIEFRDDDKKIPNNGRGSMGRKPEQMVSYHFKAKLPDNARLVLFVATPKATVTVPFSLPNTVLP